MNNREYLKLLEERNIIARVIDQDNLDEISDEEVDTLVARYKENKEAIAAAEAE